MRVISQDGTIDVPYEMVAIQMDGKTIDYLYTNLENDRLGGLTLGKYSTLKKALKAMEMLREQYARIEIIKTLVSGTCKYMEESLEPEEFKDILEKYINMEVFQFPQDNEIEV